jgi:hypothetical protein
VRFIRRSSLLAAIAAAGLASGFAAGAQTLPVPVRLHVTTPKGAAGNASIGIAARPGDPFSFYRSDAAGDVTVSLAPGPHGLRIFLRGYPVSSQYVDVTAATTVTVALGHAAASAPARPAAPAPVKAPAPTPAAAPATTPAPEPASETPAHPAAPAESTAHAAKKTPAARASAHAAGPSAGAARASAANPLRAYASCSFPDGLQIMSVDAIDETAMSRFVDSAVGPEKIDPVAAEQVMFAWPSTDYFANMRVEQFPADRYENVKDALLANLSYLESQPGGPQEALALPSNFHGFEVHGNNRQKLESSVLGMYVVFDDSAHVAATIHFLNQQSWRRKFQTMDDYARLRDRFLSTFTGCVRQNQAIEK